MSRLAEELGLDAPAGSRVALGRNDDGVIRAEECQPILVLGAPRTGKTTGFIVPSLLEWDGPAIVTSVRRDIVDATIPARSARGRAAVFEPTGRLGDLPRVGWDPVQLSNTWDEAYSLALWLTHSVPRGGMTDGEFWYAEAHRLLATALRVANATGGSMRHVLTWLQDSTNMGLAQALDTVGRRIEDQPSNIFSAFTGYPDATAGSIRATALSVLTAYQTEQVLSSTEGEQFDADAFLDGDGNTLYLCVPPDSQQELAPILTGLVRHLIGEVYARDAEGRRLTRPLLIALDEAGNICRLPDLDRLATTAAGSGMQLVTIFHNMNQAISAYGAERAATILVNHGAMVVFPGMREGRTYQMLDEILLPEELPADVVGRPSSLLRRLQTDESLCVYCHLPPEILLTRRSFEDPELVAAALKEPGTRD